MGDDVEVQPVGLILPGIVLAMSELHVTVTGLGVLPVDHRDDLEPFVAFAELPGNRAAEIALEDVEDPPDRPIDMDRDELPALHRIMIEVPFRPGFDRRMALA